MKAILRRSRAVSYPRLQWIEPPGRGKPLYAIPLKRSLNIRVGASDWLDESANWGRSIDYVYGKPRMGIFQFLVKVCQKLRKLL